MCPIIRRVVVSSLATNFQDQLVFNFSLLRASLELVAGNSTTTMKFIHWRATMAKETATWSADSAKETSSFDDLADWSRLEATRWLSFRQICLKHLNEWSRSEVEMFRNGMLWLTTFKTNELAHSDWLKLRVALIVYHSLGLLFWLTATRGVCLTSTSSTNYN